MIRTLSSAALASLLLSSCIAVIATEDEVMDGMFLDEQTEGAEDPSGAQDAGGDEAPGAADAAKKLDEVDLDALEYAVIEARASMDKGALGGQISLMEAEQRVGSAHVELVNAQAELEHFDSFTAPKELAERTLSVERSEGRLFESRAELKQLEDMYADEEFATSSKELVLERGRRNVNFTERSLELARKGVADHEAFDLAKRRANYERGVQKAEMGVLLAEMKLEAARMGRASEERSQTRKLAKAEEALAKAQAKIESGEAVAAD